MSFYNVHYKKVIILSNFEQNILRKEDFSAFNTLENPRKVNNLGLIWTLHDCMIQELRYLSFIIYRNQYLWLNFVTYEFYKVDMFCFQKI